MKTLNSFYSDKKDVLHNKIKPIILGKSNISLRDLENFIIKYSKNENISYRKKDGEIFSVHTNYKAQLSSYSKDYFDPFKRTDHIKFRYLTGFLLDNDLNIERISLPDTDVKYPLLSGNLPIVVCSDNKKETRYIKDIYPDDIIVGVNNTRRKVIDIYECGMDKFCIVLSTLNKQNCHKDFINGIMIVHELETTISQLNFFKWVIENEILEYIESNYKKIKKDKIILKKKINVVTTPYLSEDTLQVKINISNEPIIHNSSKINDRKKSTDLEHQ